MKPADIDNKRLIELYVDQELTAKACAKILSVGDGSICRRLRKIGITVRSPIRRLITGISDEQVIDLYWNQKLSISETAKSLGQSDGFVRCRLKKFGRVLRSWSDSARQRRGTSDITDEQLIYLHDVRDWTCAKISRHFGKSEDFNKNQK